MANRKYDKMAWRNGVSAERRKLSVRTAYCRGGTRVRAGVEVTVPLCLHCALSAVFELIKKLNR